MNGHVMQFLKRILWFYVANPEAFYCNLFSEDLIRLTPDVVMAIDLPTLPVAALHARRCGAKLVYDSHELYSEQEFSTREKHLWKAIEEKFIHQCDAVITVNQSIASELQRRYGMNSVHVIHNAINSTGRVQKNKLFHQTFGLPLYRKILLFQGGLSKGRHLETLVHAMKYINNQCIDLVILGDGQVRKALERLALSLGIKHRVYFHPVVPQHQLLEYTQSADVGVIPYQATCLNNLYCTPNKLFEFIAAGIPILGSNLPEINHIVLKHPIGLTGNMNSPDEFAHLIERVFSNDEQLETWKKNTLMAQQQFSWKNEEQKLLHIFRSFIV
jgi:glycosyltransferase involved in cell wall biosynthesis